MTDPTHHICIDGVARMHSWRIFQVGEVRYAVGRKLAAENDGITLSIIKFDATSLSVLTLSGSFYVLDGPQGEQTSNICWTNYCRRFQIQKWQDVSDEIWQTYVDLQSRLP